MGGCRGRGEMKRICPCFTPPWIMLTESAQETVSLPRLAMLSTRFFFSSRARDFTTFRLHYLTDFYVERATASHYNKLSFMFSWPLAKFKTKLKLKHLWEEGLRSLRILRIGRIVSDWTTYWISHISPQILTHISHGLFFLGCFKTWFSLFFPPHLNPIGIVYL